MDIDKIVKSQTFSSQISLIVTSICFQLLVLIGYIRSILLKEKELTFFVSPLLFISILMISISFGLRKNNEGKSSDLIIYILLTFFLSILLLVHFFYRKLLRYKTKIHSWSLVLLFFCILLSFVLLI